MTQASQPTFERWATWFAIFESIAVLASTVGIWQIYYFQKADAAAAVRRERAMQITSLEYNDAIMEAKGGITKYIIGSFQKIDRGKLKVDQVGARLPQGTEVAFATVADYYSRIIRCRSDNLCDAEIIDRTYARDICIFYGHYRQFAAPTMDLDYGVGEVAELKTFCKA